MPGFKNVSTYKKILFLVLSSSFLFFALTFSIYFYTIDQEKEVYKSSKLQFQNEVNTLLKLNSESMVLTISDITYWDEMVDFMKTKDLEWYNQSIVTSMNLYKVDYMGVYDLDKNLLASSSTHKIDSQLIFPKESLEKVYREKLSTFFMKTPKGIVEVFGATIHPSDDPLKNKTKPSGYFFMVRLIDSKYKEDLEKISNSKTFLMHSIDSLKAEDKSLVLVNELKNWNGETISNFVFKRDFNVTFSLTKQILKVFMISFGFLLLFFLFYLKRWIFTPLILVTSVLESGNSKAIKRLKRMRGEFGYIGDLFFQNIKQQKQLNIEKNRAEESDRLKTAFLTNLSHEIRTPMNAILGFSELLDSSSTNELEKSEYLKIIKNSGQNLVSIIDDLIEMSKIDSNLVKPNESSIAIDVFIEQLYDSLKGIIPTEKKIALLLVKSSSKMDRKIITDEIKLRQIITNLIVNAIKFTTTGFVKLTYNWNEIQNKLEFSVEDTGIGIDKENQDLIFDRFRRIDGDYAIKAGGLGLGLAITKAYVEMLKGEIRLKSTLGKGSKFSFTIPVTFDETEQENEISKTVDEVRTNSFSDATILVAEDDNINFLLFERMIKTKNYKVIRARDGEEAVAFCKNRNDIDAILMDIKMPRMSGFDAFLKIRTFNTEIPIIAQTAFSSSEEIEKIKELGFDDYITKPIEKAKLIALLDNVLEKKNV